MSWVSIPVAKARQDVGLTRFLAQLRPATARAVRAALSRGLVDRERLIVALHRFDVAGIARLFAPIADAPLTDAIRASMATGGQQGARQLPGTLHLAMTAENPYVAQYAGNQAARLVQFVNYSQQQTIRAVVENGLRSGQTVMEMADSIERTVGLLPTHAVAVDRFRQSLLDRGTALTRANTLADGYARRLLRYRAMNIARTETATALHTGERLAWEQAANEGLFDPTTAQHQWLVAAGACAQICAPMAGQVQPLGKPFVTGEGGRVLSPPTHPSCRCSETLVLPEAP